jgi:serine/threonine-protein kinase
MASRALDKDSEAVEIPSRFGRYAVVREVGRGGMAHVFEGRHPELGLRVALKVMAPALAAQPQAAARFLREAKAASHIRHQNVVEVFDIGTENSVPFIVMEFVEGTNLASLLVEKGPLSLSGVIDVFLPVISAVATAHAAGVIHRDLKPANLMIARRPPSRMHPMVLDFGISKITNSDDPENTFTRSESLLGTVLYMAPELTRGAKFASAASDQYAIGVMLYECATGRRPFAGEGHYELMHAIVTSPVVPPSRVRPELPPEFDAIVERAMHRDPTKRFPSLQALGSALLSLGDKTAWTLWENEFIGASVARELWTGTSTFHDDASPPRSEHSGRRPLSLPAKERRRLPWSRIALIAALAYAGVVTMLLRQSGTATGEELARTSATLSAVEPAAPTTPTAREIDERLREERLTVAALPSASTASSAPEVPAARSATLTSAPSTARPRPATRKESEPSGAKASPREATSRPTTRAPAPSVVMGTNGAPIVD